MLERGASTDQFLAGTVHRRVTVHRLGIAARTRLGIGRGNWSQAEIPEKCRTGISSSTWCARASGTVAVRTRVGRCRAQPRKWVAGAEMSERHYVEHLACTSNFGRDLGCVRGMPSRCRVLLDGVRGVLGQAFHRAPGVLDSRCWVPDRVLGGSGSGAGRGLAGGPGFRFGLFSWTGLRF